MRSLPTVTQSITTGKVLGEACQVTKSKMTAEFEKLMREQMDIGLLLGEIANPVPNPTTSTTSVKDIADPISMKEIMATMDKLMATMVRPIDEGLRPGTEFEFNGKTCVILQAVGSTVTFAYKSDVNPSLPATPILTLTEEKTDEPE